MLHAYYLLPMLILSCLAFNTEDGKHYISLSCSGYVYNFSILLLERYYGQI